MRRLRAPNLTSRVIVGALVATFLPLAIAYVALGALPRALADDAVRIYIRDASQLVSSELDERRFALREQLVSLGDVPASRDAILDGNVAAVRRMLGPLPEGTVLKVRQGDAGPAPADGPVAAYVTVTDPARARNVTLAVFQPIDKAIASQLSEDVGMPVAFVREGRVVAQSGGLPDPAVAALRDGSVAPRADDEFEVTTVEGTWMGARSLGADDGGYVVVAAPPRVAERIASESRADVLRPLGLLALASLMIASIAGLAVNRINKLDETSGRFERTLQTIVDGVCLWSDGGKIELWNAGAEKITGVRRDELEARPQLTRFLAGERAPGTRRVELPAGREGARSARTVDLVVSEVAGGGVLQTFQDVTELEQFEQTRRNFMATAAHQLRTPLTTILGFASTLSNPQLSLTPEQREHFLTLITEQAEHLQRLTDAFFTNHRLASDHVEISLTDVSVRDAVHGAIGKLGLEGRVTVTVPASMRAVADLRALTGILTALLDNAVKYGADPITVAAVEGDADVRICVRDAGPGVSHRDAERLFDPFYRVDVDMRESVGGAGLGLFTASKLAAAMHGSIELDSRPGETTFSVHLPTAAPATAGAQARRAVGREAR